MSSKSSHAPFFPPGISSHHKVQTPYSASFRRPQSVKQCKTMSHSRDMTTSLSDYKDLSVPPQNLSKSTPNLKTCHFLDQPEPGHQLNGQERDLTRNNVTKSLDRLVAIIKPSKSTKSPLFKPDKPFYPPSKFPSIHDKHNNNVQRLIETRGRYRTPSSRESIIRLARCQSMTNVDRNIPGGKTSRIQNYELKQSKNYGSAPDLNKKSKDLHLHAKKDGSDESYFYPKNSTTTSSNRMVQSFQLERSLASMITSGSLDRANTAAQCRTQPDNIDLDELFTKSMIAQKQANSFSQDSLDGHKSGKNVQNNLRLDLPDGIIGSEINPEDCSLNSEAGMSNTMSLLEDDQLQFREDIDQYNIDQVTNLSVGVNNFNSINHVDKSSPLLIQNEFLINSESYRMLIDYVDYQHDGTFITDNQNDLEDSRKQYDLISFSSERQISTDNLDKGTTNDDILIALNDECADCLCLTNENEDNIDNTKQMIPFDGYVTNETMENDWYCEKILEIGDSNVESEDDLELLKERNEKILENNNDQMSSVTLNDSCAIDYQYSDAIQQCDEGSRGNDDLNIDCEDSKKNQESDHYNDQILSAVNKMVDEILNKHSDNKCEMLIDGMDVCDVENRFSHRNSQENIAPPSTDCAQIEIIDQLDDNKCSNHHFNENEDTTPLESSSEDDLSWSGYNEHKTFRTDFNDGMSVNRGAVSWLSSPELHSNKCASRKRPDSHLQMDNPLKPLCNNCLRPAYFMERISISNLIFHKSCFRCRQCQTHLNFNNCIIHHKRPYCQVHARSKIRRSVKSASTNKLNQIKGRFDNKIQASIDQNGEEKQENKIVYKGIKSAKTKFFEDAAKTKEVNVRNLKRITPPREGVNYGVVESQPMSRDPSIVSCGDYQSGLSEDYSLLSQSSSTKETRARFKELECKANQSKDNTNGGMVEQGGHRRADVVSVDTKSLRNRFMAASSFDSDSKVKKINPSDEIKRLVKMESNSIYSHDSESSVDLMKTDSSNEEEVASPISRNKAKELKDRFTNLAQDDKSNKPQFKLDYGEGGIYESNPQEHSEDVIKHNYDNNVYLPKNTVKSGLQKIKDLQEIKSKGYQKVDNGQIKLEMDTCHTGVYESTPEQSKADSLSCKNEDALMDFREKNYAYDAKKAFLDKQKEEEDASSRRKTPNMIENEI